MEVDEKFIEQYIDVGGFDKQIEELVEVIVWLMKEVDWFKKIGIKVLKGLYKLKVIFYCCLRNMKLI